MGAVHRYLDCLGIRLAGASVVKTLFVSSLLFFTLTAQAHTRSRETYDFSTVVARAVRYHQAIRAAAARNSIDPHLLWTIAYLESRFQPHVVSPKGARGMMQFIPATGRRYGLVTSRDLHDPLLSIAAAARYIRELNEMFGGRIDLVLAGYNAGENSVIKSSYRVPPYLETRSYVARGLSVFRRISKVDLLASRKVDITTTTSREIEWRRQTLSTSLPSRSIYFR
jgi:soluble lytic murein transglycosylase-like protein